MEVAQAICERLLAAPAVTAIAGTRGWVLKLPQTPRFPAFRVTLISTQEPGQLRGGRRMQASRVQVDAIASESDSNDPKAAADGLASAIADALMNKAPFVAEDREVSVVDREVHPVIYNADELREVMIPQDFIVWSKVVS
jgi:hypothetical protein